uniref:Uncharacterized protein n=1 Tax=Candidatus Kentrum sp. TC TaxID=2126339 RepID=A0A450YVJ6_9GAMM|nr:MAG: hypothetical protein BECKTC1821E_GA0114239_10514 [Candidatus Kentron sp. TC]
MRPAFRVFADSVEITDAVAKPAGGYLLFVPRGEAKTAIGREIPSVAIHWGETAEHRVTLANRGKYQSVIAH